MCMFFDRTGKRAKPQRILIVNNTAFEIYKQKSLKIIPSIHKLCLWVPFKEQLYTNTFHPAIFSVR